MNNNYSRAAISFCIICSFYCLYKKHNYYDKETDHFDNLLNKKISIKHLKHFNTRKEDNQKKSAFCYWILAIIISISLISLMFSSNNSSQEQSPDIPS